MLTDTDIQEGSTITPIEGLTGRRWRARLIEGDRIGSTGFYPAETLLRDGPKVFKKGIPIYLNHRPKGPNGETVTDGRVQDYVGELAEDAYYDNDGLYAEIEVFEDAAPMIKARANHIGMSIRARGRSELQTINGKQVPVFKELVMARSVDFVSRAGAGGKLVELLESATDDSASAELNEGRENMTEEVLEALRVQDEKFTTALGNLAEAVEALKPVVSAPDAGQTDAEESAGTDFDRTLEIAEALSKSTLDADGRARVIELHRANGKNITDLIEAEEAYVKKAHGSTADADGFVETDAEESAKNDAPVKVPSFWNKGNK